MFLNEYSDGNNLFFGVAQVIEKTVASLKANGILAYSVHVVLLNLTKVFCRSLFDNGYTFAGLLPVCTTDEEQDKNQETIKKQEETVPSILP